MVLFYYMHIFNYQKKNSKNEDGVMETIPRGVYIMGIRKRNIRKYFKKWFKKMKNEQDKSRTNEGNERRKSNRHGKSSTNRMAFVTLEKCMISPIL